MFKVLSRRHRHHSPLITSAHRAAVEFLEQRCLLSTAPFSLTATQVLGPYLAGGTKYTYQQTADDGTSTVHKITAGDLADSGTFSIDDEITVTDPPTVDNPVPTVETGTITTHNALLNGAYVVYGSHFANNSNGASADVTDDPYSTAMPAVLEFGQTYTYSYTETTVGMNPGHAPTTNVELNTDTISLASDQTKPVTVPEGTFNCYEIDTTSTSHLVNTPDIGSPSTEQVFYALGVGVVRDHTVGESDASDLQLGDFVSNAKTLTFSPITGETAAGDNLKPPIVVKVLDKDGNLVSTGAGSTASITVAITGGGTLGGTVTVAAVGGIATFDTLSIPAAGTYSLTASGASFVSGTSDPITISAGTPAELTPTLPRLNYPVSAVGGARVSINASVTVTNNTASTVTGTARVTAMLVGPNGITPAIISGDGLSPGDGLSSGSAAPATVSLQVGKTVSQHVNIKSHKTGKLNIHITSLPNVAVAGSYSLEFVVTDPKGNTATVIGPSINIGPAMIALSETISSLKIPSTITIGQKLKAASIKLIVKNSGNVIAKGKTTFSVSASTTAGVAGTSITSYSTVLNTAPNKTKPVTINIKTLPALAAGSYFIVVQATDSLGGTSVVSAATPIAVSA